MPRTKQAMEITSLTVKGESGAEYAIRLTSDGALWCSCPGMKFQRQAGGDQRLCKHVEFVTRKFAEHFAKVRSL